MSTQKHDQCSVERLHLLKRYMIHLIGRDTTLLLASLFLINDLRGSLPD